MSTKKKPEGMGEPIKEIYVGIIEYSPGDEGVPSLTNPATGQAMPMVTGSKALLKVMRRYAEGVKVSTGKEIKFYKYSNRERI